MASQHKYSSFHGTPQLKSQEGGGSYCDWQVSMATASVSWDIPAGHFGKEVLALQSNANLMASALGLSALVRG